MTRDEILAMPAGIEMDALVAAKIFEWHYGTYHPELKRYSTDISAVWEVVEKLRDKKRFSISDEPDNKIRCIFWWYPDGVEKRLEWAFASTAPLAICRSALLTTLQEQEAIEHEA